MAAKSAATGEPELTGTLVSKQMRILTWNCNRGPAAKKLPLIASLKPTISILQECPRPKEDESVHPVVRR